MSGGIALPGFDRFSLRQRAERANAGLFEDGGLFLKECVGRIAFGERPREPDAGLMPDKPSNRSFKYDVGGERNRDVIADG
jgi:hypothetical protein